MTTWVGQHDDMEKSNLLISLLQIFDRISGEKSLKIGLYFFWATLYVVPYCRVTGDWQGGVFIDSINRQDSHRPEYSFRLMTIEP